MIECNVCKAWCGDKVNPVVEFTWTTQTPDGKKSINVVLCSTCYMVFHRMRTNNFVMNRLKQLLETATLPGVDSYLTIKANG